MKNQSPTFYIVFLLVALFSGLATVEAQAIKVEVQETENGWELLRDGQPYYINGGGGKTELKTLVEIGGNSFRTWSADEGLKILDQAQELGLTVMMGLWVQHERHGFDYNNEVAVQKQLEKFTAIVKKLKDHPALLLWGIGNEVDLNYSNTKVWYAINDIAKMVHELDPLHPTTTVTAGLDKKEVELILERAPEIDIYSVNTYGGLAAVTRDIKRFGWKGPYLITEWGPNGHWEVAKTKWGVPIEQTSSEKAESYFTRYQESIAKDPNFCLGSYVFLWGHKQETTSTWYGLFSKNSEKSEAVNKLEELWTGKASSNYAPIVDSVILNGQLLGENIYLEPTAINEAKIYVRDPNGDPLKIEWRIINESTKTKEGGDEEAEPEAETGLILSSPKNTVKFRSPKKEGAYRLFVFVFDGEKHYSYANIPFYALPYDQKKDQRAIRFKKQSLESFNQK